MKREVEIGDYKLVPYTNKSGETKSFFVMGNTYDIKEELRQLGGTWASFVRNPYTNTLGVWIFSLTRLKDVENWLRGTPTRPPNSNVSKSVSKRRRNKSYIDENNGNDSFSQIEKIQIEHYFNNYEIIFEKKPKLYEFNTYQYKIRNKTIVIEHTFNCESPAIKALLKALTIAEIRFNSHRDFTKVFEMIKSIFLKTQLYEPN